MLGSVYHNRPFAEHLFITAYNYSFSCASFVSLTHLCLQETQSTNIRIVIQQSHKFIQGYGLQA